MTLTRLKNNKVITEWYTKPTNSNRYLHFNSDQPTTHKKTVIDNLIHRTIKLTHHTKRKKQINKAKFMLKQNNYPIKLINNSIKKQVHKLYNNQKYNNNKKQTPETEEKKKKEKYVPLPYISGLSEKLNYTLKPYDLQVAHKNSNNLKCLFTPLKDKIEPKKETHTVYKIPCNNCEGVYIGQTKQYLEKRIQAHKYAKTSTTALNKHTQNTGHSFNFNKTSILHKVRYEKPRPTLEIIEIQKHKHSLNDKTDSQNLSTIYNNIIKPNQIV
jgi:hypothetical protein